MPDLTDSPLDDILEIARETWLSGLVATNATISRDNLRTAPAYVASLGAGGIHSVANAGEKLDADASLIQPYTGCICEGPALVSRINGRLVRGLPPKNDGPPA